MSKEELLSILQIYRNVMEEEICPDCSGFGVKTYSNTSTWHGGIGGQALRADVCNKCWGSGNKNNPWPSHKEYCVMQNILGK